MKSITYSEIPDSDTWAKDSSVMLAIRKNEPGLLRIDQLLEMYGFAPKNKPGVWGLILCDLFLTIEYWFSMREKFKGKVNEGRLPAMRALFEVTVAKLGPFFADRDGKPASAPQVSNAMKLFVGAGMSNHGYLADDTMGFEKFTNEQVYSYRLWFKGGLAYQMPWWTANPAGHFELASSKHGYLPVRRPKAGHSQVADNLVGWAPFIMTLDRFIYMAKHDFDANRKSGNYFHSSYNNGQRVTMAGTMNIHNGQITGIRMDSGHYQPGLHNLVALIWALKMYGVDLKKISLLTYTGDWVNDDVMLSAEEFAISGQTWDVFLKGMIAERTKLDNARMRREARWP
jgi:hypothetical protein